MTSVIMFKQQITSSYRVFAPLGFVLDEEDSADRTGHRGVDAL